MSKNNILQIPPLIVNSTRTSSSLQIKPLNLEQRKGTFQNLHIIKPRMSNSVPPPDRQELPRAPLVLPPLKIAKRKEKKDSIGQEGIEGVLNLVFTRKTNLVDLSQKIDLMHKLASSPLGNPSNLLGDSKIAQTDRILVPKNKGVHSISKYKREKSSEQNKLGYNKSQSRYKNLIFLDGMDTSTKLRTKEQRMKAKFIEDVNSMIAKTPSPVPPLQIDPEYQFSSPFNSKGKTKDINPRNSNTMLQEIGPLKDMFAELKERHIEKSAIKVGGMDKAKAKSKSKATHMNSLKTLKNISGVGFGGTRTNRGSPTLDAIHEGNLTRAMIIKKQSY